MSATILSILHELINKLLHKHYVVYIVIPNLQMRKVKHRDIN
jgi:hypothetical protein